MRHKTERKRRICRIDGQQVDISIVLLNASGAAAEATLLLQQLITCQPPPATSSLLALLLPYYSAITHTLSLWPAWTLTAQALRWPLLYRWPGLTYTHSLPTNCIGWPRLTYTLSLCGNKGSGRTSVLTEHPPEYQEMTCHWETSWASQPQPKRPLSSA